MNFTKLEGETILKEAKANKASLLNSKGGKLTLTDKRIVFMAHKFNIGKGAYAINFEDILAFDKAFSFFIFFPIPIPNAISIVTKDGQKHKFIVGGRKAWLTDIHNAIEKSKKKIA